MLRFSGMCVAVSAIEYDDRAVRPQYEKMEVVYVIPSGPRPLLRLISNQHDQVPVNSCAKGIAVGTPDELSALVLTKKD